MTDLVERMMGTSGALAPNAPRSVGVEEELLIVEPGDGRPVALADEVLFRSAAVSPQGSAAFSSGVEPLAQQCASTGRLSHVVADAVERTSA